MGNPKKSYSASSIISTAKLSWPKKMLSTSHSIIVTRFGKLFAMMDSSTSSQQTREDSITEIIFKQYHIAGRRPQPQKAYNTE